MSFDKATRNALAKLVAECRRLLTADIRDQLQRTYGLQPDGTALPIANLQHLDEPGIEIARELRVWQDHLASTEPGTEQKRRIAAFDRLAQETAFTTLNRLAALRLCEERGHILECVRRGKESDGFALYEQLSSGALGSRGETYRQFLQRVYDELAQDLGVLFDRGQPQSLVFPGVRCLEEVLTLLNDPALQHLWQEDETIGWIYQYYNSQEERKRMREESAAPRNSHELAVRNQFFTPRYVVEFLTDNTLGRIWYEMTKGATSLKDKCRYLVRRPNEVFLNVGQDPPVDTQQDQMPNKSQEQLLKEPVYIPHRPLKDPREILLLDPACGSMHFGLYAFDLFEVMYEEIWDNHLDLLADLRKDITDKREFLVLVPKLIIEHNLHGIDIDSRCTQIAGLSLWLRSQKAWQRLGLKLAERPRIARSNIVCAEPMPGEKELLREFTARLESPAIGQLVEMLFDKMQLAGETGSLLKIEQEIKSVVAEAKMLWKQGPKYEQAKLFGDTPAKKEQQEFDLDLSGVTDEQFWDKAEEQIYTALREYAEQAENGSGYQRRLFAEDTAGGFAFIDLSRKRYDVVVMNPPFGEATDSVEPYLAKQYAATKNNLYSAFVERSSELCPIGFTGLISARTFVMYRDFEKYRREFLLGRSITILCFADLGWEVLDGAQVETAAFVLERSRLKIFSKNSIVGPFFRLLNFPVDSKGDALLQRCGETSQTDFTYFAPRDQLTVLPGAPLAYWASRQLVDLFSKSPTFEPSLAHCGRGAAAHAFFFRLAWEVPSTNSTAIHWRRLAHGGEYSPFFRENSVVIDWENNGKKVKEYILKQYPYLNGNYGWAIQDEDKYGLVGLTSGKRNERFNAQLMPADHIFTHEGQGFIPHVVDDVWFSLGYLNSSLVSYFLSLTSGLQKTWVYIRPIPVVDVDADTRRRVEALAQNCFEIKRRWSCGAEEAAMFVCPWFLGHKEQGLLRDSLEALVEKHSTDSYGVDCNRNEISAVILEAVHLDQGDRNEVEEDFKRHPPDIAFPAWRGFEPADVRKDATLRLFSFLFGNVFGRWDIRFATGEKPVSELPDPFAPLPVCPPGMLQSPDSLPAGPAEVPANYPLRISWPGILLDDPNHPEDMERRVREVIEVIWKERAEAVEHEACEILGVRSLRDYFRKPSGFFWDHLKRYTKNRRQAPIYWPLSSASGSYTVWIYYHRLNHDFLYKVVNDYVTPKVYEAEKRFAQIETGLQRATGREATNLREAFEENKSFLAELQDFKAELLRVAELPYKPNLNDGVLITAAPLWKLFRLPKWRKDLKECWEQLEAGDYDWAHLACSVWPERVQEKCKIDRSLAIAHGLEHLCETSPRAESSGSRQKRKAKAAVPAES